MGNCPTNIHQPISPLSKIIIDTYKPLPISSRDTKYKRNVYHIVISVLLKHLPEPIYDSGGVWCFTHPLATANQHPQHHFCMGSPSWYGCNSRPRGCGDPGSFTFLALIHITAHIAAEPFSASFGWHMKLAMLGTRRQRWIDHVGGTLPTRERAVDERWRFTSFLDIL